MIKIRLARAGRPHNPVYSILAIDSRKAQNGTCLENLGTYSPKSEEPLKGVKMDRVATWVKNGALLTDTVQSLFKKAKINLK